ncbi:MAG TPA: Uma2 family endonuclease [Urbifossiella sp.]|jgi:Uma2 family endonuclease|nr:Uma2 family endonuclease [Urbifossiella sp.]
MATATATAPETTPPAGRLATTADLLALPDDGIERWLVDGRIVEVGMTIRNRFHARIQSRVSHVVESWLDDQAVPQGSCYAGEVGVRLRPNPDRTVGIDFVYLAPDVTARVTTDDTTTLIDGVPTLAVEILSPSDTIEDITQKVKLFRDAGVPQVWLLHPDFRTVAVHRPVAESVTLNATQELDGGDVLPGFRVPVARLFPG